MSSEQKSTGGAVVPGHANVMVLLGRRVEGWVNPKTKMVFSVSIHSVKVSKGRNVEVIISRVTEQAKQSSIEESQGADAIPGHIMQMVSFSMSMIHRFGSSSSCNVDVNIWGSPEQAKLCATWDNDIPGHANQMVLLSMPVCHRF